jgi:hypothetical protein
MKARGQATALATAPIDSITGLSTDLSSAPIMQFQVVKDGVTVWTSPGDASTPWGDNVVATYTDTGDVPGSLHYYYVRALQTPTQHDQDPLGPNPVNESLSERAWSSPFWIISTP